MAAPRRPDVLFLRSDAKTKTPYWPPMNADERRLKRARRSFPGRTKCTKPAAHERTAVAPYISAGRSMPVVGAHAAIWILVFLVGGSLAGGLPRRSGAVGGARGSSNYSVASGWPPGGCRRRREGRRATENGGDGNISPACDRRFRPGEPRSLSGWSVA
jgi:hypothetical protein